MALQTSSRATKPFVKPATPVFLMWAAWWGLASGLVEVCVLALRHQAMPIMKLGAEYVWMAPVTEGAFLLIPALFLVLVARLWKRIDATVAITFFCSLLAFLNLLILIPRFHHFAAVALAAGIATQMTGLVRKRSAGFHGVVRRTFPWMIAVVIALGAGVQLRKTTAERQTLAGLPAVPREAANVLFITLDTVRAPNMSVYGYGRPTTPHLEALSKLSVVFDHALSAASWTLPSHANMFTGRWSHEMTADYATPLDATHTTLAEFFGKRGYETAGFVANYGYCGSETGLNRGFGRYEDYPISLGQMAASTALVRTIADNFRLRRLIQNDEHLNRKTADDLNRDVLQWIDRERNRPFFVFINYFDAHDPYLPPAPFDTRFGLGRKLGKYSPVHHWFYDPASGHRNMDADAVREEIDAYDGAVAYLDDRLNALFTALKERNLWNNTLVVITSDHGEEFGEHRMFGHGNSLYLTSLHVPLMISLPGRIPGATRVHTPVSLRDLPATIADVLSFTDGARFPGASLARYWNGGGMAADEEPLLSELNHTTGQPEWFPVSKGNMKSLLFRGLRYIKNGDGSEELYDFYKDPLETNNLVSSDAHGAFLIEFRALLDQSVQ